MVKRDQLRYPKTAAAHGTPLLSLINRQTNKSTALTAVIRQELSVAQKTDK